LNLYEAVDGQVPADKAQSKAFCRVSSSGTSGNIYQVTCIADSTIAEYTYDATTYMLRYNPEYAQYIRVYTVDNADTVTVQQITTEIETIAGLNVTNSLIKENSQYVKLTDYIGARTRELKYTTIKAELYHGNCYNTTNMNKAGMFFTLGVGESSITRIASSKLYSVTAGTTVSFSGANNLDPVNFSLVFFNDEYITTVDPIKQLSTWQDYSMTVPSSSTMMAVQYSCPENNVIEDPVIYITFVLDEDKPTRSFPRSQDSGYQHLTIKNALTNMYSNLTNDPSDTYAGTTYAIDHGVLCLPESYNPNGAPTRLICFTHGHAVNYSSGATRFDSTDIKPEYWLSEGYAIFDMDGTVTGSFSGNHDYEANVVLAYDNAYNWIVSHYNIRKDGVFTAGRSQGGGMQFLLAKRSCMPIIASCPIVPTTRPLGYIDSKMTGAARKDLLSSYGVPADELDAITWTSASTDFYQITQAEKDCIVNNQYRYISLVPGYCYNRPLTEAELSKYSEAHATRNTEKMEEFYDSVKDSVDISIYRDVPFRMFTCVTDPTVWYYSVKTHCKTLANAGSLAQIHVFPTPSNTSITDHRFEINPENLVAYTNSKGVSLTNVPKVYIEILAFWRRFESEAR